MLTQNAKLNFVHSPIQLVESYQGTYYYRYQNKQLYFSSSVTKQPMLATSNTYSEQMIEDVIVVTKKV